MRIHWSTIGIEKVAPEVRQPEFSIENLRWEQELYGNMPSMICRFEAVFEGCRLFEYLFMDHFRFFLKQDFPEVDKKFADLHEYIGGFGTRHRQMVDMLTESGFDFEFYIRHILENYVPLLETYEEQRKSPFLGRYYQVPEDEPLISADGEEEDDDDDIFKIGLNNGYRWEYFCDALMEEVIRLSHKFYPDLLHASPEIYKAWKGKMENHVIDLANENVDFE